VIGYGLHSKPVHQPPKYIRSYLIDNLGTGEKRKHNSQKNADIKMFCSTAVQRKAKLYSHGQVNSYLQHIIP